MSRSPRAMAIVAGLPHTAVSQELTGKSCFIERQEIEGVVSGILLCGRHGKAEPYRNVLRQGGTNLSDLCFSG